MANSKSYPEYRQVAAIEQGARREWIEREREHEFRRISPEHRKNVDFYYHEIRKARDSSFEKQIQGDEETCEPISNDTTLEELLSFKNRRIT